MEQAAGYRLVSLLGEGGTGRDLAADPSGWYARIGTEPIRAYDHTAAPVRGS
ncbi:hypothetical protein [Streptomyces sp. CB02115]|uniref:hypothetical protein n=1 Tax=Streptomyces sp. CB02115 TaxID=1703939 RepID=UPI000A7F888F|nr:hypothetical protein [Streptomyces sp. CB02115]